MREVAVRVSRATRYCLLQCVRDRRERVRTAIWRGVGYIIAHPDGVQRSAGHRNGYVSRMTVTLTDSQYLRLCELRARTGLSLADYIRASLEHI